MLLFYGENEIEKEEIKILGVSLLLVMD